jgi:hypothetical protein
MYHDLKLVWVYDHTEGDRDYDQSVTFIHYGTQHRFNTATLAVEVLQGPQTGALIFNQDQGTPGPEDYSRPTDVSFHFVLDGAKRTDYFHDGAGGFTTTVTTLVATATPTLITCFGESTGAIDLVASDGYGAGNYTFLWADGPTTADRENIPAGFYTCTIKDEGGATVVLTVEVKQNPRIDVLVRTTDDSISLQVSGGVAPYTFTWDDDPAAGAERLGLGPGSYACIVTDSAGCQAVTITHDIESYRYYFSKNPIVLARDAGPDYRDDPETKPNLSFRCTVYIEPEYLSGEYVQVGTTLEQPADRFGRTSFQVQELLDSYLEYHVPAVGQRTITRADSLFRRFKLEYAEVFGTPPVPGAATVLSENYVLKGGLDFYEQGPSTFLQSYQPAVMPFLTWQPNDKVVALDQPEFLYHQVLNAGVDEFVVRALVRYSDGSSLAREVATVSDVQRYEVYCLPAGFAQLGLADVAGKQVTSWDVFVTDGAGVLLSEKRHYLLDRRPLRRRYLLFNTSLGGMATYAVSGEADFEVEVTGEEMELNLPLGYDVLQGDTAVQQRQLRPVLKVASGLQLDRATLLHLQELLLARRVLLLNGPRWLAGYLKTARTPLVGDTPKLRTLDLDFYLPRQKLFTPLLPVLPAGLPVPAVGPDAGAL